MSRPKPQRRSIRLPDYDYTQDGGYFITICTYQRALLLGDAVDSEMQLNTLGCIVQEEWERTPAVRPYVQLNAFVVMPNHLHGILFINWGDVGATWQVARPRAMQRIAPTNRPIGAET